VPMSYPPRPTPGLTFLGDFLAPPGAADFSSDPALMLDLERHLGEPYRPWDISVHDGGNEPQALAGLTSFLDHHLRAVRFLMDARPWDLFLYDLMATDRIQHELWHAWDPSHRLNKGRRDLAKVREGFIAFWSKLDAGIGEIEAALPADTTLVLMSDHGFGPVEHFVNFNVWLLEKGFIQLIDTPYVKQKHWFYRRGVTPEWIYNIMARFGQAKHRVSRFGGSQDNGLDRLAESVFLSRRHVDWSKTKAYAQGNFGQIFLNRVGRQPNGCVAEADVRPILDDLKAELAELTHPETGAPLVERVYEADELYDGPMSHLAPDLTVVLADWRYRTIGLHDFTTHKVISPAFGPTGDHRMEGVFLANGPGIRPGATLDESATLLDIAPTVLHLLGVPSPDDLDGRLLSEVLDPAFRPDQAAQLAAAPSAASNGDGQPSDGLDEEDDEAVKQRLADLGYL
jgi:predicted AlkP superfamily phosphohydrolase/phosphomutase